MSENKATSAPKAELIRLVEQKYMKEDVPNVEVGSTVRVHLRIKEANNRERIQVFEGIVIGKKGGGVRETFRVMKSYTNGGTVERIFMLHSPLIQKIEVVSLGKIRRAKLYYLRNLQGRKIRIKKKLVSKRG